jgi:uncharacterized protein (TIGR02246 family)
MNSGQLADGTVEAVRDLYTRLLTAWNERDADRFGALFAPDGECVGFDGSQMHGPQIAAQLGAVFADHPTAAYVAKVRQVRAVGPDAALLRAIAGMVPPGAGELKPDVNAVQTLLAERAAGGWRIVLLQNTPAQHHGRPDLVERHTAELAPLVGTGVLVA